MKNVDRYGVSGLQPGEAGEAGAGRARTETANQQPPLHHRWSTFPPWDPSAYLLQIIVEKN